MLMLTPYRSAQRITAQSSCPPLPPVPQPQPPEYWDDRRAWLGCLLKPGYCEPEQTHPQKEDPLLYGGVQASPSHLRHLCSPRINTHSRGEGPPLLFLQHQPVSGLWEVPGAERGDPA